METREKIKAFLEKESQRKIESDSQNLIETGALDSFSMIKLVDFIEKEFNVKANMEELTPENFNSIDSIGKMIGKWQK